MTALSVARCLAVWVLLINRVQAIIRVESTGKSFKSWPDKSLGPRLAEDGRMYRARLQQLEGNSHLCYPPSDGVSWNVTVPADGSSGKSRFDDQTQNVLGNTDTVEQKTDSS